MPFTHLHLHTEYSLLDGANRIKDLGKHVKELGMDACAITDHGVLYGTLAFYVEMKKHGVKPILGCEVYVAPRSYLDKRGQADKHPYHLILLAENETGWKNLMWLDSEAFINGFYYKPRIDMSLLERRHEGLIALSACLGGEIPQLILQRRYNEAKARALAHDRLFGRGHYFLEIQANDLPEQAIVNRALIAMSKETGIPLVATNDCHYMNKSDAFAHDVLLCMQTGKTIDDDQRMRMGTDELYVKSPEEMASAFADVPEAIENTAAIARRCTVELDLKRTFSLPDFATPHGESAADYLRHLAREGLKMRLATIVKRDDDATYWERLEHELDVIISMGYANYYLIVWDFVHYAKASHIFVGPGRGSGPGSLVAYALTITNVDPIRYHLLFERFLNPERVSMPDFDIDMCIERRGEVINYVTEKYGADCVAQVISFGTLAPRLVIRDVGRALNVPLAFTDRLAKMVPAMAPGNKKMTIAKALAMNPDLKRLVEENEDARRIFELAQRFEGMPRHSSTHAAGVVITGRPVSELAPLSRNNDVVVVQYAKKSLESVGLMKFDFLGLRTLTVLREAADMAEANHGVKIDFEALDFDDPAIYQMIAEGETAAVFQLEGRGMTAFMKELKPSSFEDIIAGISLYRPGPMEQIPQFVKARHDKSQIRYAHPRLEPILNVTYGSMVYQEQVMQIVRDLGGFTMGQSDNIRRAMANKDGDVFARYRKLFIYGGKDGDIDVEGAIARGVPEAVADTIFADVTAFSGYAFNKSHASAYAVVAYYTAWMKHYYPVEFMAAMMNSFNDVAKIASYIRDARHMGIDVRPPDVNRSVATFAAEQGAIRFGLGAIKSVGAHVVQQIVDERDSHGPFASPGDFMRRMARVGVGKSVVEALIQAGALDAFDVDRAPLLAVFDTFMASVTRTMRQQIDGQLSFFDASDDVQIDQEPHYPALEPLPLAMRLEGEKAMLGIYISGHPLDRYDNAIAPLPVVLAKTFEHKGGGEDDDADIMLDTDGYAEDDPVIMAGIVLHRTILVTKSDERMCRLIVEDKTGTFEVVVFSKLFESAKELTEEGTVIAVAGRLSFRGEGASVKASKLVELIASQTDIPKPLQAFCRTVHQARGEAKASPRSTAHVERAVILPEAPPEEAAPPLGRGFVIRWHGKADKSAIRALCAMFEYFHGPLPVYIYLEQEDTMYPLGSRYYVSNDPGDLVAFAERYGMENVGLL